MSRIIAGNFGSLSTRISAGDLSRKANKDTTNYNLLELGHAVSDDVEKLLYDSIAIYKNMIDEDEFCVIRINAGDPLIKNARRYKYYCWPYLPSPRPDQAVFLYNRGLDRITKRLWILPNAARMAQLASTLEIVPKEYQTMQAWSVAFFKGEFWEYIRYEHDIKLLSEHEYFLAHREELIKAGCQVSNSPVADPFDFSKIAIEKIIDTQDAVVN